MKNQYGHYNVLFTYIIKEKERGVWVLYLKKSRKQMGWEKGSGGGDSANL